MPNTEPPILSPAPAYGTTLATGARPPAADLRRRVALFVAVAALAIVPVALVRYPPVTDLAQQVAQIPLVATALGEGSERYLVQWTAPNKLAYPLLAAGWFVGGAEYGARIGLGLCLLASLAGIHLLAGLFARPLSHVALASAFVWSAALYWGFFGFVVGTLPLALWLRLLVAQGGSAPPRPSFAAAVGAALLLYESHILWLAAGAGLLVVFTLARRTPLQRAKWLALALAPFCAAAAAWNFATASWKLEERVLWDVPILERVVSPRLWVLELFGGLQGAPEIVYVAALAVLGGWALFAARRHADGGVEPSLALAALVFLGAVVVLPDRVDEALFFSLRWGSIAGFVGVLALPALPTRPAVALGLALVLLGGFVAVTARAWVGFDRNEMRGFEECRRAVPTGSRLLALDFARFHPVFWNRPTYQMSAYAQLDRDVDLAFSFSEHRSSLVVERRLPRAISWTRKLEHLPERVTPADVAQFDAVLIHARARDFPELLARLQLLEPIAGEGEWRLCRVRLARPG